MAATCVNIVPTGGGFGHTHACNGGGAHYSRRRVILLAYGMSRAVKRLSCGRQRSGCAPLFALTGETTRIY